MSASPWGGSPSPRPGPIRRREVYADARGLASVELGVPLNLRSVFRVGSLSKTVTAATVMQLNAQGKLDLDAPIAPWLPTFPRGDVAIDPLGDGCGRYGRHAVADGPGGGDARAAIVAAANLVMDVGLRLTSRTCR